MAIVVNRWLLVVVRSAATNPATLSLRRQRRVPHPASSQPREPFWPSATPSATARTGRRRLWRHRSFGVGGDASGLIRVESVSLCKEDGSLAACNDLIGAVAEWLRGTAIDESRHDR